KADELIRLAELKMKSSSLSSLNLSSTSIAVMCVDLASTASSLHLDKTMAIKLSGLTKKSYTTAIKILQQMLNMKQDMSISNLSIQFGCSEAKQLAINIFKRFYQDSQQNLDLNEMNVGLFNCASLYISCRKLKIKVDRRKMISYVGVQASVFNRLVEQMDPVATNI
ncbi:hypothetical protein HELRODRAFT_125158, partial [Helobdella robusta]|uniref:Origin recognition complex subunit 6 n=1 Tax=Helobdella robusta TaxID=6412 RepID=T1EH47_HELRO